LIDEHQQRWKRPASAEGNTSEMPPSSARQESLKFEMFLHFRGLCHSEEEPVPIISGRNRKDFMLLDFYGFLVTKPSYRCAVGFLPCCIACTQDTTAA